jgi:phosphate transport system substrate-binding protein
VRTKRETRSAWVAGTVLLLAIVIMAGCGEPLATPETVFFQVTGAMAMEPLLRDLASAFHERNPAVSLEVSGPGTQYGLETLRGGDVDVALASWLPPDLDPEWQAVAIARDGIAMTVHPSNPVQGLGLLQLQDLFSGRVDRWAGVGGQISQGQVQLVSREDGSGTGAAFQSLVMQERRVTPLAVVAPSPQAVIEYVAEHREAIGYVSMSVVDNRVKALKVEGVLPLPDSASQGIYPLSRELWMVTTGPPPETLQAFFDFVLSPAGQQIVGRRYGRIR